MTQPLTEDDIYRKSSQYRLWSFSPESLAALRRRTHDLAVERARRYLDQQPTPNGSTENGAAHEIDALVLTEEEEARLVQRYCEQIRATNDHFKWPVNVKATAVQYLKRFYLSNSCITYPPKEIYKTVLFLACKTEATHMTVSDYARRIATDPEQVLAPEYKVMQALRFTLDVRQPFRGLKGVLMELLNLAAGKFGPVEGAATADGKQLQQRMESLSPPSEKCRTQWKPGKSLDDRIQAAYIAAKAILDAPALLTDAYFLYTPSQILLAALHLSDSPLTTFYLSTKLPTDSPLGSKILATIHSCAEMLSAHSATGVLTKDERADLEKKLERCRDPSTRDLVKIFAANRQGDQSDEGKAERRKMEREKSQKEANDLFGPSLSKANG